MTQNGTQGSNGELSDDPVVDVDAPDSSFGEVEDVTLAASSDVVAQIRQQAQQLKERSAKSDVGSASKPANDLAGEALTESCDSEADFAIWTPDGDGGSDEAADQATSEEPEQVGDEAVVSIGDNAGEFASDSETVPASAEARARLAAAARALAGKTKDKPAFDSSAADADALPEPDEADSVDLVEDDDTNPRREAVAAGMLFDDTTTAPAFDKTTRAAAIDQAMIAQPGPADAGPMLDDADPDTTGPDTAGPDTAGPEAAVADAVAASDTASPQTPAAQVLNELTMPPSAAQQLAVPRVGAESARDPKQIVVDDGVSLIDGMAPPAASASYWQGGASEQSSEENAAFWSAGSRKRIPMWVWAVLAIAVIIGASVLISLALTS